MAGQIPPGLARFEAAKRGGGGAIPPEIIAMMNKATGNGAPDGDGPDPETGADKASEAGGPPDPQALLAAFEALPPPLQAEVMKALQGIMQGPAAPAAGPPTDPVAASVLQKVMGQ